MPPTSAQKALNIDTIVDEIIWLLQAGSCDRETWRHCASPSSKDGRRCGDIDGHLRALLRCILVCRKWSKIGMAQLWGIYTTDMNLLSVISDSPNLPSWYRQHYKNTDARSPRIIQSRLDRWHFYTKYVRTLTISGFSHKQADLPGFLLKASALAGSKPLLPSLKSLVVKGSWLSESVAAPILSAVLSSSVRHFEMIFQHEPTGQDFIEVMDMVPLHAPNLTFFSLRMLFELQREEIEKTLCKFLPTMASLQILRIEPEYATVDLLLSISQSLPHLRVLDFQRHIDNEELYISGFPAATHPVSGKGPNFPSLDYFLLQSTGGCCDLADSIKRSFGSGHHLPYLSVVLRGFPTRSGDHTSCITGFCAAFAQTFPAVQGLELDCDIADIPIIRMAAVEPLLSCGGLTEVSLTNFKLSTPDELVRLLTAWPNLTALKLIGPQISTMHDENEGLGVSDQMLTYIFRTETGGLSLECMHLISKHLPKLEELAISLIASPTKDLRHADWPFKKLKVLDLLGSFHNFRLPGFCSHQAARYLSSFLYPGCVFTFPGDSSIQDEMNDNDEGEEEENQPWIGYGEAYVNFCERMQDMVTVAVHAREDEVARRSRRNELALIARESTQND